MGKMIYPSSKQCSTQLWAIDVLTIKANKREVRSGQVQSAAARIDVKSTAV